MSIKPLKLKIDILIFTLTRTAINTSYRMVYPFLPFFARGLGVEPASLALAFSVRSFLGVFGPFLATVADTHDRRTGMLLGIGLFTAGSGLVAIWPGFWTFILATSLTLLGNGVFIPSMNAFLGDHTPYNRRGRVLAITELSWAAAFIGGIPIVRSLVENHNWTTPFILFTIIGVLAFVLYLFLIPAARVAQIEGNTIWKNLGRILKAWPALAGLLAGVLFTTANEMINLIFGVWIENQFGLDFAALTIASVVIGISELGGEVITGLWLDSMGKRRMIWIFLGLNSLAAILLPFTSGQLNLAMIGLGFFYITFETVLVSAMTLMSEVMPKVRATMLSATIAGFSLGRMLGDLIAPSLFQVGFWLSCLAAVVLNLAAGFLLTQVRVRREEAQA
jgi:predicted MFS family arabinose efflux permease